MNDDSDWTPHVAFSASVKEIQRERGSRRAFANVEPRLGYQSPTVEELADFLSQVDTAFLATASADGLPYAQHRGGPKGFIKILDEHTLGFADFMGNRQYITTGNLAENDRAFLILMDYAERRRVKIWGHARVIRDDADLLAKLMPEGYRARPDQAILFDVEAWDINCPQHIPMKLDANDVSAALEALKSRITSLERENAELRNLHSR